MPRILLSLALCGLTTITATAAETPSKPFHPRADLPPLLEMLDGRAIRDRSQWPARRNEIKKLMCDHFIGHFPKSVPALLSAKVVSEEQTDNSLRRRVRLTFDTPHKASFEVHVWIPRGKGPFPILLTQPRYYQMGWAEEAVRRGYLACLYPGVDSHHREKDYPGYDSVWQEFRKEYPQANWAEISTKAWLASRALDYLLDPSQRYRIVPGQVGIIGFSRYGKQSLIATAFDERITAVVARSAGSPGECPYRFTSRNTFAEAPADFPSEWFLPSLRGYTGREHELPFDSHGWLGLIAPRRCMLHVSYHDDSGPTFAAERAYTEGRSVYRLFARRENLVLDYRRGGHVSGPEPDLVTEPHRRRNFDWFDLSFNRGAALQEDFPEKLLHQFDWQAWKAKQPTGTLTPPATKPGEENARGRIRWALGERPDKIIPVNDAQFASDADAQLFAHDRYHTGKVQRIPVLFGENVRGNIYYNPDVKTAAPAVIWLHPYNYPIGYAEAYGTQGASVFHRIADAGYVVLAFDQCGFGSRLFESRDFYKQHPSWSKLGRMVHDVHSAVDFLSDGQEKSTTPLPLINGQQIFVLGYSVGGMAGLYAAALDERITGVASFSGFTPLRTDTDVKSTGGIRRLWQWHALQPRLGLFHGHEEQIPYDYEDVLALISPRPCLIVSPQRDRDADINDIARCLKTAANRWREKGVPQNLTHQIPNDSNRFQKDQQDIFLKWLALTLKTEGKTAKP